LSLPLYPELTLLGAEPCVAALKSMIVDGNRQ